MHLIIKLGMEHILTDIFQRHISVEMIPVIDYREDVSLGSGHNLYKLAQRRIDPYRKEIRLDQVAGLEKGKHGLVAVVGQELSPLRYSLRIY